MKFLFAFLATSFLTACGGDMQQTEIKAIPTPEAVFKLKSFKKECGKMPQPVVYTATTRTGGYQYSLEANYGDTAPFDMHCPATFTFSLASGYLLRARHVEVSGLTVRSPGAQGELLMGSTFPTAVYGLNLGYVASQSFHGQTTMPATGSYTLCNKKAAQDIVLTSDPWVKKVVAGTQPDGRVIAKFNLLNYTFEVVPCFQ